MTFSPRFDVTLSLSCSTAHNNMASTDEDRKVETCLITV